MIFSQRLPCEMHTNELSRSLQRMRAAGERILDLTESNPTHAGIAYPPGFLDSLSDARSLLYEPEPFGLRAAREHIAQQYGAPMDRVVLTASTSEAYAWLFKLLCDPGDEVLAPRPSYPLFEYLAALESVQVRHYGLFYDHGWSIDIHTIERSVSPRTRAIVVVNPNNPTGQFLGTHELAYLEDLCAEREIAIISDEVFSDYVLRPQSGTAPTVHGDRKCLSFSLNGLSKSVGLPQMKLAWTIASGPNALVTSALERLEIIADTYLSAGTPVQVALPALLALREPVQRQILGRLHCNLGKLQQSRLRFLQVDAGWYAILQLPPSRTEEEWALHFLEQRRILMQPGYFYDFERPGFAVISLLSKPEIFAEAIGYVEQDISRVYAS